MSDWSSSGYQEIFDNLESESGLDHSQSVQDSNSSDELALDPDYIAEAEMKRHAEIIEDKLSSADSEDEVDAFAGYCEALTELQESQNVWVVYQEQNGVLEPLAYADEERAFVHEDLDPAIEVPEKFHSFSFLEETMSDEYFDEFMSSLTGFKPEMPEYLHNILAYEVEEEDSPSGELNPWVTNEIVAPGSSQFYDSM